MPNVNAVLNEQITRLARRVVNSGTKSTRRLVTQHRRDVAALKRQVASLLKTVKALETAEKKRSNELPTPANVDHARFRRDGLKSHRAKLGLSAKQYGKLVGVSELSVYNWESGRARPSRDKLARLVAVRALGKREAMARLGLARPAADNAPDAPARGTRRRGTFSRTGVEAILAFVKKSRKATTAQVNAAWKKEGRAGVADKTLGEMVKARQLKRAKVKGVRGSVYTAA